MQSNDLRVAQQISERESLRWKCTIAGDFDQVEQLMCENARYVHSSSHVDSSDSFLALCRDRVIVYHDINYDIEVITVDEDVAIVGAHMRGTLTAAGSLRKVDNTTTATWIRRGEFWMLLAFQATNRPTG